MGNNTFNKKDFGLKYGKTKSDIKAGNFEKEIFPLLYKDLNNSLFIAYMYDGITIGKFVNGIFTCSKGAFNVDWEQFLRLRIFNIHSELYIFKTSIGLKYRLRTDDVDSTEKLTGYVETNQVLFGTITKKASEGYTMLTEDRGTEIILPYDFKIEEGESDKRVKIKTRNYIDYIDNHATYVDIRFVEFVFGKNNQPLKGELS